MKQIVHIFIPLTIGGILYIAFRDNGLLMFKWFDFLNITDYVIGVRKLTLMQKEIFPILVRFSFPNALWTYSLTTAMIFIWKKTLNKSSLFWILLGPLIAIFTEIAQYFGLLRGTFDINDLILCVVASMLALTHIKTFNLKPFAQNEKENTYIY